VLNGSARYVGTELSKKFWNSDIGIFRIAVKGYPESFLVIPVKDLEEAGLLGKNLRIPLAKDSDRTVIDYWSYEDAWKPRKEK
jgi:hypothetical protein